LQKHAARRLRVGVDGVALTAATRRHDDRDEQPAWPNHRVTHVVYLGVTPGAGHLDQRRAVIELSADLAMFRPGRTD
jgi:hypothetical protein